MVTSDNGANNYDGDLFEMLRSLLENDTKAQVPKFDGCLKGGLLLQVNTELFKKKKNKW